MKKPKNSDFLKNYKNQPIENTNFSSDVIIPRMLINEYAEALDKLICLGDFKSNINIPITNYEITDFNGDYTQDNKTIYERLVVFRFRFNKSEKKYILFEITVTKRKFIYSDEILVFAIK